MPELEQRRDQLPRAIAANPAVVWHGCCFLEWSNALKEEASCQYDRRVGFAWRLLQLLRQAAR